MRALAGALAPGGAASRPWTSGRSCTSRGSWWRSASCRRPTRGCRAACRRSGGSAPAPSSCRRRRPGPSGSGGRSAWRTPGRRPRRAQRWRRRSPRGSCGGSWEGSCAGTPWGVGDGRARAVWRQRDGRARGRRAEADQEGIPLDRLQDSELLHDQRRLHGPQATGGPTPVASGKSLDLIPSCEASDSGRARSRTWRSRPPSRARGRGAPPRRPAPFLSSPPGGHCLTQTSTLLTSSPETVLIGTRSSSVPGSSSTHLGLVDRNPHRGHDDARSGASPARPAPATPRGSHRENRAPAKSCTHACSSTPNPVSPASVAHGVSLYRTRAAAQVGSGRAGRS